MNINDLTRLSEYATAKAHYFFSSNVNWNNTFMLGNLVKHKFVTKTALITENIGIP